jgi:hypothetical protein
MSYTHRLAKNPSVAVAQPQITNNPTSNPPPAIVPGAAATPAMQTKGLSTNTRFALAGAGIAGGTYVALVFISRFFHVG